MHEGFMPENRYKIVTLLESLLQSRKPEAFELESLLFSNCQNDWTMYQECVQSVAYNLYVNWESLKSLSVRDMSMVMNYKNMTASEKVEETERAVKCYATATPAVEGQIRCGRCKSVAVSVEQKQTRGADESMTVFVQCESCGLRWKM